LDSLVPRQYIVDLTEQPSRTGTILEASSVNSMSRSLKAFCRWLHWENLIDRDLFAKVNVPKAPSLTMPVLSSTELRAILGAERRRSRNPLRDEAVITFMLDTGARASEVCDLDLGSIIFEQELVNLFGKGRKARILPFSAVTSRVHFRYIPKHRGHDLGRLFVSDRGARLTRSGLPQLRTRIGERAGVDVHPRQLRLNFALN
jgi:site-specific recombinase XerD